VKEETPDFLIVLVFALVSIALVIAGVCSTWNK
jgi:hypothetical protein